LGQEGGGIGGRVVLEILSCEALLQRRTFFLPVPQRRLIALFVVARYPDERRFGIET